MPARPLSAEVGGQRLPVDKQLESARRSRRFPRSDPIFRADPNAIRSGGWNLNLCGRISHRLSKTVSQQIRRAHETRERRIERPAAKSFECFGFDEDGFGVGTRG